MTPQEVVMRMLKLVSMKVAHGLSLQLGGVEEDDDDLVNKALRTLPLLILLRTRR
jgi:hypothetical protein